MPPYFTFGDSVGADTLLLTARRSARGPGADERGDQRTKEGADVERDGDMRPKT